jgi:hypothetical protein
MRIRRTVIAPVILALAAVGSLVVPAAAALTSVAPAANSVAAGGVAATGNAYVYHT